jgi:hypothetical protein
MISQLQLSLFDIAGVIQPTYKVGDLVKIRKRPIAASYVKKGDIVQVAAVHPIDGSIKFWNERSERFEFVYPNEISSIVSPANNDSVSTDKAQIADTEYTVPPADNDSVSSKAISTYSPRGTARSGEYFRFSYRDGFRMRHIHIRGGETPIRRSHRQKCKKCDRSWGQEFPPIKLRKCCEILIAKLRSDYLYVCLSSSLNLVKFKFQVFDSLH